MPDEIWLVTCERNKTFSRFELRITNSDFIPERVNLSITIVHVESHVSDEITSVLHIIANFCGVWQCFKGSISDVRRSIQS